MKITRDKVRGGLANAWSWVKRGTVGAVHSVQRDPTRLLPVVGIALAMWVWLGLRAGILWGIYVVFLVYDWNNRVIVGAATAALCTCFGLSMAQAPEAAERVAGWAYLLFWMVVALQFIEYKRHPERFLE